MLPKLDREQSIRLRKTSLAAAGGAMLSAVLVYAYYRGYTHLNGTTLTAALSGFWTVNITFVALIVSGGNLRFQDPAMSQAQMYWAASTTLVAMALLNHLHELLYILLFTVLAFGMFRLTTSQYNRYCAFSIAGFGCVQLGFALENPRIDTVFDPLLTWLMFSFCTVTLTLLCNSLVALRTHLKDKNQELEQALKIKSTFMANMSHEIRTPMNGVLGMLGIVLRGELSDEQREHVRIAESSATSLLTVINDILDFSKIEAGGMALEKVTFNPNKLVHDVADAFSYRALEKALELVVDTAPNLPPYVQGDPGRLRQVLNNLIGNAIKFTDKGEIVVHCNAETTPDGIVLSYSVSDTGIGIDKQTLNTLFKPFTQADVSTTREYGGTGLGLSIAKQLCQLMGGDISVQSTPEHGSTFTATVLVQLAEDNHQATAPHLDLSSKKVLIVDDNATNRLVLSKQLEAIGAQVDCAANGFEAFDYISNNSEKPPYPLAIIDFQMPKMDGEELVAHIRRDPDCVEMKIIMLTSMHGRKNDRELSELGVSANLTKPIKADQLYANIVAVLSEKNCSLPDDNFDPIADTWCSYTAKQQHNDGHKKNITAHILVVEDNPTNQAVARITLEDLGCDVEVANNGQQALHKLKVSDRPFDLILMDCQMPVMDGYSTTHAIRSGGPDIPNPKIPIVAMTANVLEGDEQKCLVAGMDDFLRKPIEFDTVVNKLEKWLGQQVLRHQQQKPALVPDERAAADTVWDHNSLLQRVRNKEERVAILVKIFLENFIEKIEELNHHIEDAECTAIRECAHSIKGSTANLSAISLQHSTAQVEKWAKELDIDHIVALQPTLNSQAKELRTILESYLQQRSTS